MSHSCRPAIRCLLIWLAALSPACAAAPTHDLWFVTSVQGQPAGYVHERRELVREDGRTLILTSIEMRLNLKRLGTELEVTSLVQTWETEDGRAERFYSESRLSAQKMIVQGHRTEQGFRIETEAMGTTKARDIPWSDDVLFPAAMERRIVEAGLEPGQSLVLKSFSPEFAATTNISIAVQEWEELELGPGRRLRLLRLEWEQDLMPGLRVQEWQDASGEVYKTRIPMMGLALESVRATREQALAPVEAAELLAQTLVDVGVRLERPRELVRSRWLLRLADGGLPALPADGRQRPSRLADGRLLLEVWVEDWAPRTGDPEPDDDNRQASPVLQADAPEVRRMARSATRGHRTPEARARAIVSHVHDVIRAKDLSVGLATAKEVAQTLEGDCTEHAVLAAALGRAVGIPSKVATGLVYFQGQLGYHMWTELWVDGAWRGMDPALGQEAIDATHIKLGESPLAHGFVDEGVAALVPLIASLEAQLVDYVVAGEPPRYVRPRLGLSVELRDGWTLELPAPVDDAPLLRLATGQGGRLSMRIEPRDEDVSLETAMQRAGGGHLSGAPKTVRVSGRSAVERRLDNGHRLVAFDRAESRYTFLYEPPDPAPQARSSELGNLLRAIHLDNRS